MKVLWLIPARSGSKGISDKNVKLLGAHPLLAYRVKTALRLADPSLVWVSTDSDRYADIAKSYGATIPALRPHELATDTSTTIDVVFHALELANSRGLAPDVIGVLEPTSPFVQLSTLKQALDRLVQHPTAAAIVATRPAKPSSFFLQPKQEFLSILAERIRTKGVLRRQDEVSEITPSGGFYLAKCNDFLRYGSYYTPLTLSHEVSPLESLEIDDPLDWDWAEFLLKSGKVNDKDFGF